MWPSCSEFEDWNHATLCENNRNKREEWVKSLVIKLKSFEQNRNTSEEERGSMKEIVNDANIF